MKASKTAKSLSNRNKRLLIIGFLFFINPVPAGLDILPDVFGCALIFFGLTQLAYFDSSIEAARKSMIYLFAVEALHLVLMRPVFLTNISSNRMLAVTSFSIVQAIIYVMFFKNLFSGISYYASRHDCDKTSEKCDSVAFLSYLAFFIRIGATLIPELIAILELRLNLEVDFETYDTISSIVAAKPILIVLFSCIALGSSVAWFVSTVRLFTSLHSEAGNELDAKYTDEYTSRPEKVRPRRVRTGNIVICISLLFALDVSFDGIRILPASFMFAIIFAASFMFGGISKFSNSKRLAIPAFLLTLATEIYRMLLVPNGAIVIYETELWIVAAAAVPGIAAAVFGLICVRGFLADIRKLSVDLGGSEKNTEAAWIAYCISTVLWTAGFVIPYFFPTVATPRLLATCVFIWQTAKTVNSITEDEFERYSLYGEQTQVHH